MAKYLDCTLVADGKTVPVRATIRMVQHISDSRTQLEGSLVAENVPVDFPEWNDMTLILPDGSVESITIISRQASTPVRRGMWSRVEAKFLSQRNIRRSTGKRANT